MKVPVANSQVTKCVVSLGKSHHKTIEVNLSSKGNARVAVLQVEGKSQIVSSSILHAGHTRADFRFFNDGELWLTPLEEGSGVPMSANDPATFSFELGGSSLRVEVAADTDSGDRGMTDAKTKVPDEV